MAGQKDRKPICCGEAACCNLLEMFRGILLKLPNKACIMEKNGEDAGKCNFFIDCVKYPGKGRLKGAMGFAAGVGAFLLFFLSDYNDWRWSRRSPAGLLSPGYAAADSGNCLGDLAGRAAPARVAPGCGGTAGGVLFWPVGLYALFRAAGGGVLRPAGRGAGRLYHPECMRCAAIPGCCGLRDCMDVCGPQADCRFGRRRC